ncbi:MAG: response regulator [Elusimicrobia bacterium]|nr:response regulator [Elusimicrobiota bacterium]
MGSKRKDDILIRESARNNKIHLLIIEDNPGDADLIRTALSEMPKNAFSLECVDKLSRGLDRLAQGGIDVVLLDLSLPDSRGLETLDKLRSQINAVPIVVMTGLDDHETALAAVHKGAQDYLIKGRVTPDNLARSLSYAIERKALDRLREDSLHDINHELRTPLTCLYGSLLVLKENTRGILNPEQLLLLGMASKNADHLVKMTNDLAELLRTKTDKLMINPERVLLADIIDETIKFFTLSGSVKHIALCADIAPGVPPARADPVRFRQVLINLIGNALKFTPEGGLISVQMRKWDKNDKFIRISITDTGPGIEPGAAKRLFERLYQIPDPERRSLNGLGIGLHLCRDIVSRHGGEIWMESKIGNGSTFSFTIPIHKAWTKSAS